MTYKERQSCINTINTLRSLAPNISVIDNENCIELICLLNGGIDKIYHEHYKQGLKDAVEKPEGVFNPN